ncbi:hypothetical protein N7462_008687 [Penicillium macrosclerotiorum]|uniref:uncharacterized protein n=1 Tax=Penicillium macrosclerotiorum TaxID=303699 RepID=UPI00254749C1|nr:uncharacterized protein N7462_008687 [Penicillium macrosclerotiorum]KAJ5675790.1 hypothetical protein N7462_008687 [Penicillium macrosclerotiorum]
MSNASDSPRMEHPTEPHDITRASYHSGMGDIPLQPTTQQTRSSSESNGASLKSPRTARFAEATTVHSPIDQPRSPFADPPRTGGVGDVGFGYVNTPHVAVERPLYSPLASPLPPGLKVPNTAKSLNPLSPTFREEYMLEKQEATSKKHNARDMRIKLRVRIAKVFLRFVNFGCSLIVLSLLAVTLTVFNATKSLPTRNSLPAWAEGTNPWAQYLLLAMACVSLFACLIVFWGYYKGGHKRAEKTAVYYSTFTIGFFVFDFIMWIVAAGIYQHSKSSGNSKDLWGWSCAQNTREELYHDQIDYALLCRLQDWGLVCAIIEVVIELIVLLIYAFVAYRLWSKRKLMKAMDTRDKARSDLYLAHLRMQSAPNTPGFPGFAPYPPKSPFYAAHPVEPYPTAEKGEMPTTQYATPASPTKPKPTFQLQAPPIRIQHPTPKAAQEEFSAPVPARSVSPPDQTQTENDHMAAAPGEASYGSVPIPGAYASPMVPMYPPPHN